MSKFAEYETDPDRLPPLREQGLIVREATPADVATLAAIARERDGGDLARIERGLAGIVEAGREHVCVAEHDGEIVGFARAALLRHDEPRPPGCIPDGWYLTGVNVRPAFRRRGVGYDLTRARIEWLRQRTDLVRYIATAVNPATIALHEGFGFVEVARNVAAPGVTFTGGVGLLFELELSRPASPSPSRPAST